MVAAPSVFNLFVAVMYLARGRRTCTVITISTKFRTAQFVTEMAPQSVLVQLHPNKPGERNYTQ